MPSCYYYDEQRNRCNCYVNENLNELLEENAKLRELVESYGMIANEAVCDYYDRDEMLAEANATAHDMGIEVGV